MKHSYSFSGIEIPEEHELLQFFEVEPEEYSIPNRTWKVNYTLPEAVIIISHAALEGSFQIVTEPISGGEVTLSFERITQIILHDDGRSKMINIDGDLECATFKVSALLNPTLQITSSILAR